MGSLAVRLVRAAKLGVPAALLGWFATVVFCGLSAGALPSLHGFVLMAGGYGLAAWLVLALALVPLALVNAREAARAGFGAPAWIALGVAAAIMALTLIPLRRVLWELIPVGVAYPDELAQAASFYAAAVLGALGSWVMWRARAQTKPLPFPLWTCALLYCAARSAAVPALQLVAPGREGLFDAALLLVLGAAAIGLANRLGRRWTIALGTGWTACVLTLLATLGPSAAARAELFSVYPGSAALVHGIRGMIDLDGDGVSAVLGGPDCDDLDPEVQPLALEIAGDGIDQNCNGVDPEAVDATFSAGALPGAPKRSIVLITIDTVRADLLNERALPRLAALAKHSAVFTRSYASAPYTAGSLSSLLTGHTAFSRSVHWNADVGSEPTLAELLHAFGYATTMVMYEWWAGGKPWAIHRGFERALTLTMSMPDSYRTVTGPAVTGGALPEIARLTAADKPFFLWIHYLDPHAEYVPRSGTPFSGGTDLRSRYLQEVWATDREIGRVLDALEAARFFETGTLVVHSDHGELVEDRGRTGHAYWLDEDVLRTLLLVRGPGIASGAYATRVRLLDVMPTLLDMAVGLEVPAFGRSLRPVLEGRERADREAIVYSNYQGASQSALLDGRYKLVQNHATGTAYLYDLARDAGEAHNLVDEQPAVVERLRKRLATVWDSELNDRVLQERARRPPPQLRLAHAPR